MKKPLLIISGPTGVGKTDFVLKLCSNIPSEIVNIDVGQFYTPLSIGTAKPDWKNESIKHHLFDIIDEPKNITVVEYRKIVLEKLNEIWKSNKLPVLVGGSGFYINSLFFPPQEPNIIKNDNNLVGENIWQILASIDPERAEQIKKSDTYRITRALEIWQSTGQKPSTYLPSYLPPCDNVSLIFLTRDRDELYSRIDQRVVQMMKNGWLDEVRKLQHTFWAEFLKVKKLIGYDDILKYLESLESDEQSLDDLIIIIQKKVRNYAKRQLTFFRMLEKKIDQANKNVLNSNVLVNWINLTTANSDLYIKKILESYQS